MPIRNIRKSLAGMQDLLCGVGSESQIRGDTAYTIGKIDVPYAVSTITELQQLDINLYTHARVYHDTLEFIDYILDPSDLSGIVPAVGIGSWIAISALSATAADFSDAAAAVNTINKYAGKMVWDSTNSRPQWAVGPATTDAWTHFSGSVVPA